MEKLGPYELLDVIGQGGMGRVYRALDTRYHRTVALKVMADENRSEEFERWFRREANFVAKLNSPHIVPIHGYGEVGGTPYLDMRWVEGDSLSGIVRAFGPADLETALTILEQIADALDDAHSLGLVHRDVKPGNLLIDKRGFAYLADFGIASPINRTSSDDDGRLLGSWSYMSPERFLGQPVGTSADTYALACVLHFALTGYPPYGSGTVEQMRDRHLRDVPPRLSGHLSDVTPQVDDVIAWALAKDPRDRPESTGQWMRALREVHRATSPSLSVPPVRRAASAAVPVETADSGRTQLLVALLVALVILAVGLSALALGRV